MKRLELMTAAIFLALSILIVVNTAGLAYWEDISPGNRFMPLWVAGASALLALLLFLEASRRKSPGEVEWPDRPGWIRVVSTLAAIIAFALVVDLLGFLVGTALFILVVLLGVLRRPVVPSALAAAITVGVIYSVFIAWLSIPLPKGVFGI